MISIVQVSRIRFDPMTTELTRELIRTLLPSRPDEAHKGIFGHVLVVAGSRGFTGAARLAAGGAARAGAGLVTIALPESIVEIVAPALLESMWLGLPATQDATFSGEALLPALDAAQKRDAVVLGPGISTHPGTTAFATNFIAQCEKPLVLDADALNIIAVNPSVFDSAHTPVVLTPHPGEMARLAGITTEQVQRDRENIARDYATRTGWTVVLKGHRTIVASPDGQCAVNTTGNPGMATGGTGDVISGMIGGLLAQGLPMEKAARVAVYAHGLAGDIVAHQSSNRGMLAGDLLNAIPKAWRTIEGNL